MNVQFIKIISSRIFQQILSSFKKTKIKKEAKAESASKIMMVNPITFQPNPITFDQITMFRQPVQSKNSPAIIFKK